MLLSGEDLHTELAGLRTTGAICWLPEIEGWITTTRSAAVKVMRDSATFTVDDPRFSTGRVVGPSMLSTDGPDHQRHRRPFNDVYRPGAIAPLVEWMRLEARALVAEIAPAGSGDLRVSVAKPLAARSVHRSLGLVGVEPSTLLEWYQAIVQSVELTTAGLEPTPAGEEAMGELTEAVRRTVTSDPDSLLATVAPLAADVHELARNAAIVLFGAVETAEATTGNAFWHLLSDSVSLAAVDADRLLIARAVDESMRLEPAAAFVDRYATGDVELEEASIEAGHLVRVSLAAANRDPAVYRNPNKFRLDRSSSPPHVTFAQGPHVCLGAHMARAQTSAALESVLELLPAVTLDRTRSSAPTGPVFRKPHAIVARWQRRLG